MPFLKEKNLIFIHIPKNAGKFIEDRYGMSDYPNSEANQGNRSIISNIARAVLKLDEDSQHFAKTYGRRMFDIGLVGQHLTLIEMQLYGLVPRDLFEYKVLASVRSPYTRAISLYCNAVNQNSYNQNDFEEFCKNWTRDFNSNYKHIKFCQKRLQVDYLIDLDGNINQNINLVHVENLIAELKVFESENNLEAINYEKKKNINLYLNKPKLTQKAIKYINDNYAKDFEILNYKKVK